MEPTKTRVVNTWRIDESARKKKQTKATYAPKANPEKEKIDKMMEAHLSHLKKEFPHIYRKVTRGD